MKRFFFIILSFLFINSFAQKDSILSVWEDKNNDYKIRIEALNRYVWNTVLFADPDSAVFLIEPTLNQTKKEDKDEYLESLNVLGVASAMKGNFPKSLDYFLSGLEHVNESQIKTKIKFIGNISNVYRELHEFEESEKYLKDCIKMQEEIQDSAGLANSISNLAGLLNEQEKYEEALKYALEGKNLHLQLGQMRGYARFMHNIGLIFTSLQQYDSSIYYNQESLLIRDSINDVFGIVSSSLGLGQAYIAKGDFQKGLDACESIYDELKKVNSTQQDLYYCECLEEGNKGLNRFEKSYIYRVKRDSLKDVIDGEDAQKKILQSKYKYELLKQHAADSLSAVQQERINQIEFDKQIYRKNVITYVIVLVLILVALFLYFIYKRLQVTRHQKLIIEESKKEIEIKSSEIQASINYAKRIQGAVLPEIKLQDLFTDSFIIYKPKDVVSGDFFWWEKVNDDKILFAVADCTGHGVPGGFMSMLGSIFLNEIFNSKKIYQPSIILDELSQLMSISLKNDKGEVIKDGMDISFACLNLKTLELEWAGANNPLYIIKNKELEIIKGDRQPIGYFEDKKPFTNHKVQLSKGDIVYLFTDGYADQFGGDNNKKIGYKAFKEQFMELQELSLEAQGSKLEAFFEEWKKDEEQIDDVCVLGVRI